MTASGNVQIELSIVIAAWNDDSRLHECLSSIRNQLNESDTEVLVVSNFGSGIAKIEMEFPFAGYFILPKETTVPQLRAFGINRANGKIIAIIEDFCSPNSKWSGEIRKAHELSYAIVGGAVENANGSKALDWAVYFFDYGRYMLPLSNGVTDSLSGANVSYKKEILVQIREKYENEFYEIFIHEELKQRGHEFYLIPAAVVYHKKTYNFKKIAVQFYHQARSFAARRIHLVSVSTRLLFTFGSLVLPILLPARIIRRVAGKKKNLKELMISLPFLIVLAAIWTFGEFCGYLAGSGKSEQQWR